MAWRRSTTTHSEALTIGVSGSLEAPLILALLRHGVFGEFLRTTEGSFLIVAIAVDEVVALLVVVV